MVVVSVVLREHLAKGDVDGDGHGGIDIYVLLCMKYATSESHSPVRGGGGAL